MLKRFFQNNEILQSVQDGITDKTTSPVYGAFILSWLFFHWKFVYTAIFISEEKIWEFTNGQLKSDYLSQTFFNFSNPWFYILWILPFVFTWLFIWKFPKWISIPAFLRSQKYNTQKLEIKLEEEKKIIQKQLKAVELMEKKTEKEKEIKEQEKEIKELNPTVTWEDEFNRVSSDTKTIKAIKEGNIAIYTTNGRFVSNPASEQGGYNSYISANSLSRLDTLGLIAMVTEKRNVIEFTDKGKFFVRKLQENGII